jgi:5,10-methylenetetrahydrofolate reductase/5,10-methylene-tetrahydrofolate dehydrogenase/methenyl tetrahydrofolate cyclohydrolase
MTATVMDGEALAASVKHELEQRIETLADRGITPGLGTLLVGDDGPSANYVSMKHRDCEELGMASVDRRLPATATQAQVDEVVDELNADPAVDAFIIQYPFPEGLDYERAILRVDPAKDADGLHPVNLGLLVMGAEAPLACTPHGIALMLEAYHVPLAGRHVVIVGRGLTIGRPLANLLTLKLRFNAAVTVVHRQSGPHQGRHGQAGGGRGGGRGQLPQRQVAVRRRRRGGRGRRLVVPAHRRGRSDDPGDAAVQHGGGGGAVRGILTAVTSIHDLLAAGPTLSVEFFPPKTDDGLVQLQRTVGELDPLDLSYVSVTYGAGGSNRDRTRDLVIDINRDQPYPAMAHLTCMGHTRQELDALLDDYDTNGVHNILALAGDPPADGSPVGGDFAYAHELVDLIRTHGEHFSVGVAAHPELHPRSTNRAEDRRHLADKLERADFAVTQFFFDPDDYFRMVDELAALGVTKPIVPGVMPLTNPDGVRRMAKMAGATFPDALAARVEEAGDGPDRQQIVVDAAVDMSRRLLDGGAPGLHLYCMNRSPTVLAITQDLGLNPTHP